MAAQDQLDERDKRRIWQKNIDESLIVVNCILSYGRNEYLSNAAIVNGYDELRSLPHAGVVISASKEDDEYFQTPSSAGEVAEILEAFGLIPSEIEHLICITLSWSDINLDLLPFDWNDTVLVYATGNQHGALFSKKDIGLVGDDSERTISSLTGGTLRKHTYLGKMNSKAWDTLGKLHVARSAYRIAWLYSNFTGEYNKKWQNGWSVEYIVKAVDVLSAGAFLLDPDLVCGFSDSYIRSGYQTLLREAEIRDLRPIHAKTAKQLDDMYWMLVQQIAGEQLPAKEADIESKLRSLLISMGFDLKVRAMLEYDLPAVDIMAGQADDKIVSPGSELMQYFSK